MRKLRDIYNKQKEFVLYVFFGFLTFITDAGVFWALGLFIDLNKSDIVLHSCSVFATVIAIIFAYITNRKIVFKSNNRDRKAFLKEMTEFFMARIFTMLLAEIILQLLVFSFSVEEVLAKIIVNIIVIALNFIFSKLFIFKSKEKR